MMRLLAATALILMVCPGTPLEAAPAPFPRSVTASKSRLHSSDLVGEWQMRWSGHEWTVTLSPTGHYTCKGTGLVFVGSWGLDADGRFWITESSRPQDPVSWRSYSARLCHRSLSGRIEFGSPGTEIKLIRKK